jgi:hypothetical protein
LAMFPLLRWWWPERIHRQTNLAGHHQHNLNMFG